MINFGIDMLLKANGEVVAHLILASSWLSKTLGLMFRSPKCSYGLLIPLEPSREYIIHMLFMRFPIDLILLDDEYNVLDIKTLRPWKDFIRFSGVRWALELRKGLLREGSVKVGDVLEILP